MNYIYPLAIMLVAIAFLLAAQNALNYLAIAMMIFSALWVVALSLLPKLKGTPHDDTHPDTREIRLSDLFRNRRH